MPSGHKPAVEGLLAANDGPAARGLPMIRSTAWAVVTLEDAHLLDK